MPITAEDRAHAQDLLNFIAASPSPWHAVQSITQRLQAQGFAPLQEKQHWKLEAGGYYVVRGVDLRDGARFFRQVISIGLRSFEITM